MSIHSGFVFLALGFLLCACASPTGRLPAPELSTAITERGILIYRGRVYPLEEPSSQPTYVYERRVADHDRHLVSTHVTRDRSGVIQLAESARHDPDYSLSSYTLYANQLGQTGELSVDGDRVTFRVRDTEGERTAVEQVDATVVVGPTLVGYLMKHLDELSRGKTLRIRMAVLERLETIGFDLSATTSSAGKLRVKMSPSSLLFRLAVDPIYFTYDATTHSLLRLEGRVPPKRRDGDRWADFDARVEYDMLATHYR